MNEDKYLKNTKKRLTIIFTSLIFIIAFSLELVFFSVKYIRESNIEKTRFEDITKKLSEIKSVESLVEMIKI
jgi:hypothetical protein